MKSPSGHPHFNTARGRRVLPANQIQRYRFTRLGLVLPLLVTALLSAAAPVAYGEENPNGGISGELDATEAPAEELTPYIVGGDVPRPGVWPEIVVIGELVSGHYEYFCAGTLIRPDVVVTAAHCAERNNLHLNPARMYIAAGIENLDSPNGEFIQVARISIPSIRRSYTDGPYDIAVLELTQPSQTGVPIQFATPQRKPLWDLYPAALIAGWGETELGVTSPQLLHAVVHYRDPYDCYRMYSGFRIDTELCIGGGGQGPCFGDSGGPVLAVGPSEELLLTGVISRGPEPCGALPAIATDIAPYVNWIYSVSTSNRADRIAGDNRYETAAKLALATAATFPGQVTVYLANGENFPDALSASAAAASEQGVVLLSDSKSLPPATADALARLQPTALKVIGGETAISTNVANQAAQRAAVPAQRVSGANRYATSAAISRQAFPNGSEFAFVAVGTSFPDAVTSGPVAGLLQAPVLLTQTNHLPAEVKAELLRLGATDVIILGGTSAVSNAVYAEISLFTTVDRISGATRFETAVELSKIVARPGEEVVYLATGTNFPDALASGPLAVAQPGPILLVDGVRIPPTVRREIERIRPNRVVALGGKLAVAPSVLWDISDVLNFP